MNKKSLFEAAQAASYGVAKLPKDPRFRVQKPVYRSLAQLMLAINNHPELVRPATAFDTDDEYLTDEERRYLDKMEYYDNLKYQDFDDVNNSPNDNPEDLAPHDVSDMSGSDTQLPDNE